MTQYYYDDVWVNVMFNVSELQTLKTVLSSVHTKELLDQDETLYWLYSNDIVNAIKEISEKLDQMFSRLGMKYYYKPV